MFETDLTGTTAHTTCALPGCETPIVQPTRGGRPRLYCSDNHRAEARRRRLTAGRGTPPGEDADGAIELLGEALRRLQAGEDRTITAAELAGVRAQATGDVLAAQQDAAAARRDAADAQRGWLAERAAADALRRELADAVAAADRARAALEGAQEALAAEVVQHHQDVEAGEHRLAAVTAIHREQEAASTGEADRCRTATIAAEARRAAAEERAAATEAQVAEARRAIAHLELRATRAEMAVEQVESRLGQAREDVVAERRRSEALQQRLALQTVHSARAASRALPAGGLPRARRRRAAVPVQAVPTKRRPT